MRRLVLAALAVTSLGLLAPAASAKPDLPCDYWVHGCYLPGYVFDACDRLTTLDCQHIH